MRRPLIAPLALIAGLATLASASPALADTPPVLPVISAVGADPNDAGYLDFHATSDSAIDPASVTAQLTFRVSGERPVTTVTGFTLVSGTPEDGTWRTTARMALGAHGDYDAVVDLADADGDHPAYLGRAVVRYVDLPVFSDTALDRTALDFEHQSVTATGSVSTFDPATGVTTSGWTGGTVYLEGTRGSGPWEVATTVQPDGTYQVTGPVHGYVYVYAVQQDSQTVNTELVQVSMTASPTRIVFDKPTDTAVYGSAYTVSGTAQYLSPTTNTWTPLPASDHDIEVGLQGPNGNHAYELTSGGRFSEKLDTVTGDTTWSALTGGYGYLAQSTADAHLHALSRSVLAWSDHTFTGAGAIRVKGSLTASAGPRPTGRVELQQSQNGSTGWTTVATVTPNAAGAFDAWHTLKHPTGYLRLHYSGSANATAAVTSKVHLTRSVTRITGFNASPEPVRKGGTLTVTGNLQRQNGSSWTSLSGQRVAIYFRVPGAKDGTRMATATTGNGGKFTVKLTAKQDGTWSATYAATSQYLNTTSAGDYVDVR
ncbi:hypothetical protein [Actinacidiphila oryziradicis]|uniref:Bacterial Ig-like domain-containing protein n=1 Tax=Actinacidiphila oryziradicis TaxID=2571141 RepID=A0A4U0SN07_9ACTN|nr:hypothetical protein [Actinacidiphila oryziradicis]TKA09581.1 hypothetical protein FCI23_22380 [Actinacidiphila oryziradicis]